MSDDSWSMKIILQLEGCLSSWNIQHIYFSRCAKIKYFTMINILPDEVWLSYFTNLRTHTQCLNSWSMKIILQLKMFIIVKYSTSPFFVACKNQIFCNDTHPSWWRMIFILHELNHWICVRWFVKYENHPSIGRMFIIVKHLIFTRH